jgi:hypothetical protein
LIICIQIFLCLLSLFILSLGFEASFRVSKLIFFVPIIFQGEVCIEDGFALVRFPILTPTNIIKLCFHLFKQVALHVCSQLNKWNPILLSCGANYESIGNGKYSLILLLVTFVCDVGAIIWLIEGWVKRDSLISE